MLCEPFLLDDLDAFLHMASEEGWICDPQEFNFILHSYPEGSFIVRSVDGGVLGCITSLAYHCSGWIGNLIVRTDQRRNGIGSILMANSLDALESSGVSTVWLTASSAGAPLYERIGFRAIDRIYRWHREGALMSDPIVPAKELDVIDLIRRDCRGWGDDRSILCREKVRQGRLLAAPGGSMVIQNLESGALIGPWSADSPKAAELLLQSALVGGSHDGATYADVPGSNSKALRLLEDTGFASCSETVLMYYGVPPAYHPEIIFALASAGSIG